MGEVYLADDTRLGRRVALKLLPQQFASDVDRVRRFEQEARAVSALNHPNILTLFDLGRAGDQYFMATEFIDGRTLRAYLVEQGRLPPAEAIRIASQCAAALASAHAAGIVHRDIKPENVMLRHDGYVKVLDFGLARVVEFTRADDETGTSVRPNLTSAGVVLGTTAYLSPEQARGQVVDERTDVFSLGVVLYEMLAGTRPFTGPTPSDTLAAILREDPPPLSQIAPAVPLEIEHILTKALAKDRDARYASVAEFGRDLEVVARDLAFDAHPRAKVPTQTGSGRPARASNRRVIAGVFLSAVLLTAAATWWAYVTRQTSPASVTVAPAGLRRVKTLAVLPFTLLGYSAESEHLGLGMADALIVKLTKIRQLTVRPTSAVQKYQAGEQDVQAVGRALQVDAVLTGHVQRAAGRTRVTVQLVDTTGTGAATSSMWSDEFTTTTDDPFDVQDQLAAQLVQKLALQLSGDEQSRLTARPTSNPKALQNYMQGRFSGTSGPSPAPRARSNCSRRRCASTPSTRRRTSGRFWPGTGCSRAAPPTSRRRCRSFTPRSIER
jgi:TolB-like protein